MPWLEKANETPSSENLLFVHVPRCGGTSLMKAHKVPEKVVAASPSWIKKFVMWYFFRRYELLEKNNFPIWTPVNAVCLCIFAIGGVLLQSSSSSSSSNQDNILVTEHDNNNNSYNNNALPIAMMAGSFVILILMSYVFVAPTICRIRIIRRAFLVFVEYILCQAMANPEYITGTNFHGYLPHLTARKIIDHYDVTEDDFRSTTATNSLAIVRNPYARMVSIYMFNRFGACESFSHFVRSWYRYTMRDYREHGMLDDWYTPSHALPQFEYTHDTSTNMNGTTSTHQQLVHSVVKQEDLKHLKKKKKKNHSISSITETTEAANVEYSTCSNNCSSNSSAEDCNNTEECRLTAAAAAATNDNDNDNENDCGAASIRGLPDVVRCALLAMPHDSNQRKTGTPWYDYYDQETLNLTHAMYHRDFEIFGYDVVLKQRPDLEMPPSSSQQVQVVVRKMLCV